MYFCLHGYACACRVCFANNFPNDTLECYRTSQEKVQSIKMFRDQPSSYKVDTASDLPVPL